MGSKRSRKGGSSARQPLTKAMLLPMNQASARERSLSSHLALAACRDGHGSEYLFNELIRVAYTTWFLQQAGFGNEPVECYKKAEYAVEAALELASRSDEWILAKDTIPAFETLLALHDTQLATAPRHKVMEAEQRLLRFLAGTAPSPIPGPNLDRP
ncbi:Fis family transcriptional regulator [Caballeronia humi]|uniref:Fis family transcriptional regulator n=3 Tax=Burkholderiaceae TaxID=119060 RepID=A0A158ITV5_9BURK|nr:Fis family transcriptional regulator [Caballeronia humi]